jgi:hypothetical protein
MSVESQMKRMSLLNSFKKLRVKQQCRMCFRSVWIQFRLLWHKLLQYYNALQSLPLSFIHH